MTAQAATSVESFHTPGTVADAVAMKSGFGDTAIFLAGGTDLGVQMRRRIVEPAHLISLGGVDGFRSIDRVGDEIVIGAGVTHRQLETSPLLDGPLAALAEACRTVGSVQIRTVGTIGGNLCNASPAADTPPVLLALGASVSIAGPDGERTISLDEFFEGYRLTAIAADEILIAVRIPVPDGSSGSAFIKLGRRRAMEISIACVGARVDLAADGAIATAGIGLGSVAATTVRASAA
ncbi:FAD binding domain-containing protein, partial [bacterium]|nr:FAD binding domain-containing protein [bacterium]